MKRNVTFFRVPFNAVTLDLGMILYNYQFVGELVKYYPKSLNKFEVLLEIRFFSFVEKNKGISGIIFHDNSTFLPAKNLTWAPNKLIIFDTPRGIFFLPDAIKLDLYGFAIATIYLY